MLNISLFILMEEPLIKKSYRKDDTHIGRKMSKTKFKNYNKIDYY